VISIIKRVIKTEQQWGLKPLIIGALYEFIFFIKHPKFKYLFVIEAKDLDVRKEDKKVSERYIPTPYYILTISLNHIKNLVSNLHNAIFFDIGCGPGRTLYYASTIGFNRLIGIEQSKQLTDLCRQNLKRYLSPHISVKIVNQNVRDINFLSLINDFDQEKQANSLVFFLYTPFKDEMLKTLLNKFDELKNYFDCYIIYFGIQNEGIITQKNFSVAYSQDINQDTPLKIYYRQKISPG
jgi:SAM-dependent methyltransferase